MRAGQPEAAEWFRRTLALDPSFAPARATRLAELGPMKRAGVDRGRRVAGGRGRRARSGRCSTTTSSTGTIPTSSRPTRACSSRPARWCGGRSSTREMGHYQPLSWLALAAVGGGPGSARQVHALALVLHALNAGAASRRDRAGPRPRRPRPWPMVGRRSAARRSSRCTRCGSSRWRGPARCPTCSRTRRCCCRSAPGSCGRAAARPRGWWRAWRCSPSRSSPA